MQQTRRHRARERGKAPSKSRLSPHGRGDLFRGLTLPGTWEEGIPVRVEDECNKPNNGPTREQIEERFECLKGLFVPGDLSEAECRAERDRLRAQLADLTPPERPDLQTAAELLQDFGAIWDAATPKERKQIGHMLLETVYLDSGDDGPVTGIERKEAYRALLRMTARSEEDVQSTDSFTPMPRDEMSNPPTESPAHSVLPRAAGRSPAGNGPRRMGHSPP
ncbi:MAG: hypothetical protein ACOC7N_04640 [Chloroflexota bacterium]